MRGEVLEGLFSPKETKNDQREIIDMFLSKGSPGERRRDSLRSAPSSQS